MKFNIRSNKAIKSYSIIMLSIILCLSLPLIPCQAQGSNNKNIKFKIPPGTPNTTVSKTELELRLTGEWRNSQYWPDLRYGKFVLTKYVFKSDGSCNRLSYGDEVSGKWQATNNTLMIVYDHGETERFSVRFKKVRDSKSRDSTELVLLESDGSRKVFSRPESKSP